MGDCSRATVRGGAGENKGTRPLRKRTRWSGTVRRHTSDSSEGESRVPWSNLYAVIRRSSVRRVSSELKPVAPSTNFEGYRKG